MNAYVKIVEAALGMLDTVRELRECYIITSIEAVELCNITVANAKRDLELEESSVSAKTEINRLAKYLMKNWWDYITIRSSHDSVSAVDVAIRILEGADALMCSAKKKPVEFEVGKYYRHTDGEMLHILCEVETTRYGKGLLAEVHSPWHRYLDEDFKAVGYGKSHAVNYVEVPESEWLKAFEEVDQIMINELGHGIATRMKLAMEKARGNICDSELCRCRLCQRTDRCGCARCAGVTLGCPKFKSIIKSVHPTGTVTGQ